MTALARRHAYKILLLTALTGSVLLAWLGYHLWSGTL